ncbi:c-type cytochrome [bacterium]|nr:c-type cytochrome [bacterium]
MSLNGLLPKAALFSLTVVALSAMPGCKRVEEAEFVVGPKVLELDETLQEAVAKVVREQFGTPLLPTTPVVRNLKLKERDTELRRLRHGRDLYEEQCRQCHGTSGDGNGPAAGFMYPRPRDYRAGIFKFTTTPYGAKPRRVDLLRTVERGVSGTSMPTFRLLPKSDREAIVDYVLLLTHRGEVETRLALEAEFEEEIDPDVVPELIDEILARWQAAEQEEVHPLTVQPVEFTVAMVEDGKKAFESKGCSKCHGEDGRGMTKDNIGKDAWGFATKAADLTSGHLHGGAQPVDIYRRIISGINGTPMPGFRTILQQEPETIWNLVAYVQHVSGQRRAGTVPTPGLFRMDTPESGTLDVPASTETAAAN